MQWYVGNRENLNYGDGFQQSVLETDQHSLGFCLVQISVLMSLESHLLNLSYKRDALSKWLRFH